jgi:hypothetical protein
MMLKFFARYFSAASQKSVKLGRSEMLLFDSGNPLAPKMAIGAAGT